HGCDCGILKRQCADTLKWMRQAEKEGRDDGRAYFEAEYAYQQAGCNLTLGLMLAFGAAAHAAPCGRLITGDNNTENERLVARDVPKWALKQAPDLEANDPIWINHAVCTFCPSWWGRAKRRCHRPASPKTGMGCPAISLLLEGHDRCIRRMVEQGIDTLSE